MNTYEFITPSDPITFKAKSDKIAFVCAVILGRGKAGCKRIGDNNDTVRIPSMVAFSPTPDEDIESFLSCGLPKFVDNNIDSIKDSFMSFSYGSLEDRKTYDDAISAITDESKLEEFKMKHEKRNRTSMSQWVSTAWEYGKSLGTNEDQPQTV